MSVIKILFASASALTMAACATVGPDYAEPPLDHFTKNALQNDPAIIAEEREPARNWWTALDDEPLTALIERAFSENRDLRQAAANVEAARALLRLERTDLRPTGDANADYRRRRLSGSQFGADDLRERTRE